MPSTLPSDVNTMFVKQGTILNRHMGSHFEIPTGSLTTFIAMSMVVSIVVYERILVRILRRFTGNPRGITMLQRMGIGMANNVLTMAVASIPDMKQISVVKARGLEGNEKAVAPLTVFILLPQFLLGGVAEALLEGGNIELFYDQAPESMQSIGTALFASSLGIGNFISSFLLTVMTKITGRKGHTKWVLDNLNASRLYYYYALLAVLNVLNLIFFLVVSRSYVYKRETNEAFGNGSYGHVGAVTVESLAPPLDIKARTYENEQQSMEMVMVNSQGK